VALLLTGNPLFLQEDLRMMPGLPIDRKTGLITIIIVVLFSFNSCVEDDSNLPSTAGWSSLDPTSIPLRQRMIQANRGNLVKNPSFEQGRIINIDSNTVSNNMSGWTWIGSNVHWVSGVDSSDHNPEEVHSGIYAVKIQRESADETMGQGEGVMPLISEYFFMIRTGCRLVEKHLIPSGMPILTNPSRPYHSQVSGISTAWIGPR
jgi:hypothetical protein